MSIKSRIRGGFSLIEVLIFITVFSLFFVMAAAVVTTTLRITKENQNRIRATHYAEDLKEWIQAEREINWGGADCGPSCSLPANPSFTELVTQTQPTTTFCFNDPVIANWPSPGVTGCTMSMDSQFRRVATFSAMVVPATGFVNQVDVKITVDWKDGAETHFVPLETTFSIWE